MRYVRAWQRCGNVISIRRKILVIEISTNSNSSLSQETENCTGESQLVSEDSWIVSVCRAMIAHNYYYFWLDARPMHHVLASRHGQSIRLRIMGCAWLVASHKTNECCYLIRWQYGHCPITANVVHSLASPSSTVWLNITRSGPRDCGKKREA